MAALQMNVPFSAVALTAATTKTVVGVKAPANQAVKVLGYTVTFDGGTSTAVPVLVEPARCTFASNSPGTNSTSVTPSKRDSGRDETVQSTAAHTWTTEPTVITAIEPRYVPAYQGGQTEWIPFDKPIVVPGGQGFVVRMTAPANVNTSGVLVCEE